MQITKLAYAKMDITKIHRSSVSPVLLAAFLALKSYHKSFVLLATHHFREPYRLTICLAYAQLGSMRIVPNHVWLASTDV